jgi:dihydrofolate reductase
VAYIDDMLVPGKVEEELSRNGFARLHEVWATLGSHDVSDYAGVLTQPGALAAALNYYRANFAGRRGETFAPFDVSTPSLTLWGNRDHAIGRAATLREKDFMRGLPWPITQSSGAPMSSGSGWRPRAGSAASPIPKTARHPGVPIMRKLIALVFNYSLNGLLADEGTEYFKFCFDLLDQSGGPDQDRDTLDLLRSAHVHIMGRTAYAGMSGALPTATDHPWSAILNAGRKVVFSRTLTTAAWANTSIAAGDTAREIAELRQGGDGHILVWGGVSLWRSLMRLDLIDEFHVSLYPYVADEGTRLFDEAPKSYRLGLVSSTAKRNGVLELHYRRQR